ncbi:MAG: hypothetical protein ABJK11_04225 [Balneola sp.]
MMLEHSWILQFFDWFFPIISGIGVFMIFFLLRQKKKYRSKKDLEYFSRAFALGELSKSDLEELKKDLHKFKKDNKKK